MSIVDIGQVKRTKEAAKYKDCSLWTPRDVLVEALRMIDAGEMNPNILAVVYLEPQGDTRVTNHFLLAQVGGGEVGIYRPVVLAEAFKHAMWANSNV